MSRFLWSFLVFAIVIMVDQTEGWRRRRRRRCPVTNCSVGPWTSWSTCTQPCGTGGTQRRTRRVTRGATCGGSCPTLVETRACNRGCSNGGTLVSGRCINCKTGYSGRCCTGGNILRQKNIFFKYIPGIYFLISNSICWGQKFVPNERTNKRRSVVCPSVRPSVRPSAL